MRIRTFITWLLDVIMIKPDGYALSNTMERTVKETLRKYEPLSELEYE